MFFWIIGVKWRHLMKITIRKIVVVSLLAIIFSQIDAYQREKVVPGQNPSFPPRYFVNILENGIWIRYAVHLTAVEKNMLQQAVKRYCTSDSMFNKRIDQEDIQRILSGCSINERNFCAVIDNVLNDFRERSFAALFAEVGLSRDI